MADPVEMETVVGQLKWLVAKVMSETKGKNKKRAQKESEEFIQEQQRQGKLPGDEEKEDVRKFLEKGWVKSDKDKQKAEAELEKAPLLKRGTCKKECTKKGSRVCVVGKIEISRHVHD